MKMLCTVVLLFGLTAGASVYYVKYIHVDPPPVFREALVVRGDLTATIGATGTLEPEEVVDVGAQVVGRIREFGQDPAHPDKLIDYGSEVQEDTVLAYIDESLYQAQCDAAEAELLRARADLGQAQAKRTHAARNRDRAEQLREANVRLRKTDDNLRAISDSDYDARVADFAVAEAGVDVAQAAVKQAEAALRQARTNLDYTVIKSPVRGVIIDRRVNVGQTVVASLNAPSLFLIAKDLRRLQVWASVNEADIGRIHEGQPVRFTVDAYPDETFRGVVFQIRLNASMTQNVVNYTVVVAFENADLKLKPYLTANVQFEVEQRSNVLLVPNTALRWKPREQLVAPELRAADDKPDDDPSPRQTAAKPPAKTGQVWVRDGSFVRPVEVQVGMSDGMQTEVSGPGLEADVRVIVGEVRAADVSSETTNPFTPQVFKTKSGQGKSR